MKVALYGIVFTMLSLVNIAANADELTQEILTSSIWCSDDGADGAEDTIIFKPNGKLLVKVQYTTQPDPTCTIDCTPIKTAMSGKGFWRLDEPVLSISLTLKMPNSADSSSVTDPNTTTETAPQNVNVNQENVVSYFPATKTILLEQNDQSSGDLFSTYRPCK